MSGSRLAIVTPWFGGQLRGGAEQQSWQLAHQFAERGHTVDVLTTTCPSFTDDWGRSRLSAGIETTGNLTVRRFRVDQRDRRAFDRVNAILLSLTPRELRRSVSPIGLDDAGVFMRHNINSTEMMDFLSSDGRRYDAVIFMPYLYGTTLNGLPLVADRAYLQPCLHDEAYAYLPRVKEIAGLAQGLLFNSEGEFELALSLFGPGIFAKSHVVGEGVEIMDDPERFPDKVRGFAPSRSHYLLYLGRQDPAKNLWGLVRAFTVYRQHHPFSNLKLVIVGERRGPSFGDAGKDIIDLGPVDEDQKAALLAHCRALAQPSLKESYSRVMVEAWLHGRPVLANSQCRATATAVKGCEGGMLASTIPEWEHLISFVDNASAAELDAMGSRGRSYALRNGAWDAVLDRYARALDATPRSGGPPVHQVLAPGEEAARDYVERLNAALLTEGTSATMSPHEAPPGALIVRHVGSAQPQNGAANGRADAIVYHPNTHAMQAAAAPPGGSALFGACPALVTALQASGADANLLPVCVDPRRWDGPDDPFLANALQDGKKNLLYAGPFRDVDALNTLLLTFLNYLSLEREARLIMIGSAAADRAVFDKVFAEVRALELTDNVLAANNLTLPQLQAAYRTADLFLSLDGQDAYGTELIEAMWFDIPVAAYKTPIAEEILGSSGLLITDRSDPLELAALAHLLSVDHKLRAAIVAAQRRARERFVPSAIARSLLSCSSVPA